MHGVMEEANGSDHNEQSFTIWVMKTGRCIMQNTKDIHRTPITTEQYFHEQIKKVAG